MLLAAFYVLIAIPIIIVGNVIVLIPTIARVYFPDFLTLVFRFRVSRSRLNLRDSAYRNTRFSVRDHHKEL